MTWNLFDDPTPEEREHDRRVDEVNNAESKALAFIRQISEQADRYPDVSAAADAAITHIATVAQATVNGLRKRAFDRDQREGIR